MTRFLVLVLAFLASPALAQTPECKSREQQAAAFAADPYHERVIAAGLNQGATLIELYVSVDGTSFTITATGHDNCARIIASGFDWTDLNLAEALNPTRYRPIPGARMTGD